MITVKNSKPRPAYHPDTNLRYGAGLPGGGAKKFCISLPVNPKFQAALGFDGSR